MQAMNPAQDVVPPFFNRLVQALRSQDASQLQSLLQFRFPTPIPADIETRILSLRLVRHIAALTDSRNRLNI